MTARYLRVHEVCVQLSIDDAFFHQIREEGLIEIKHSTDEEELISTADAERLRVITVLMRDMDVNLAGAEVILHMRDDLTAMQQQFAEILRTLVEELRRRREGSTC
jgi:DNA-binding transcriptional MerR regulator